MRYNRTLYYTIWNWLNFLKFENISNRFQVCITKSIIVWKSTRGKISQNVDTPIKWLDHSWCDVGHWILREVVRQSKKLKVFIEILWQICPIHLPMQTPLHRRCPTILHRHKLHSALPSLWRSRRGLGYLPPSSPAPTPTSATNCSWMFIIHRWEIIRYHISTNVNYKRIDNDDDSYDKTWLQRCWVHL